MINKKIIIIRKDQKNLIIMFKNKSKELISIKKIIENYFCFIIFTTLKLFDKLVLKSILKKKFCF